MLGHIYGYEISTEKLKDARTVQMGYLTSLVHKSQIVLIGLLRGEKDTKEEKITIFNSVRVVTEYMIQKSNNISIFCYNGERDVLRIHLSATPWVDKYIICESKTTFTRKPKELYFFRDQRYFKQWWPKIDYYVINDNYSDEEINLAQQSPNTQGAEHWTWEFLQKERLKKAMSSCGVQPNDIVYIGDVDEVPKQFPGETIGYPAKLKLMVYAYYLNRRSDEQFWGTYVAPYHYIQDKVLNHERTRTDIRTEDYYGWHFTNVMDLDSIRRKLDSSYTAESYNTPEVQNLLKYRYEKGIDYLGRSFSFKTEEENWPQFLKENRQRFKHLLWKDDRGEILGEGFKV